MVCISSCIKFRISLRKKGKIWKIIHYDVYANKDFVKPLYEGSECKNFVMHKNPYLNRKKLQALASTLATYSYYNAMMHK